MVKKLTLQQVHPFVRYARYMYISRSGRNYSENIGLDCRLFYACKGTGRIMADGKIYTLATNDMIIFRSGVKYHILPPDDSVTYLALNFDYSFDNSDKVIPIPPVPPVQSSYEQIIENVEITNFEAFNNVFFISNISSVKTDLEKIEYTYRIQKLFYELKASSALQNVFVKIARFSTSSHDDINKNTSDTNKIIDYIHNNSDKQISNEYIGKTFNFHPNYVNSLIKAQTGHSLHGYLLFVRVSKAIELLESTDLKISDIAFLVGFEDISHFSRYFKKLTGKPPSYFRGRS